MSGKWIGGIACLIFAALLAVSGIRSLSRGDGPALGDESGLGVSHAVGAFLPAMVFLIVGVMLIRRQPK
jgi:hypothetical protein